MAGELTGSVGFRCTGEDGRDRGVIFQDISVPADWHERPSKIVERFQREAERLARVEGGVPGCRRAAFSNDVRIFLDARRAIFLCLRADGSLANVYHDVYAMRVKGEPQEQTQRRLNVEAFERHRSVKALDCDRGVEFTGTFVGPMRGGTLSVSLRKQGFWSQLASSLALTLSTVSSGVKAVGSAIGRLLWPSAEPERVLVEEREGWSYTP